MASGRDPSPVSKSARPPIYFGTYRDVGHYAWDADWRTVLYVDLMNLVPWEKIDGKLNPSEREGEAAIHHLNGWTALAFANRTDDSRPGSNSVFFFEGTLSFDEASLAALRAFPHVVERFQFAIKDTAA